MTQFEKFKNMDINQFSEWLDEYGVFDNSPWIQWFNGLYCNNCEAIMWFPCLCCELEGKCKYFPDLDEAPDNKMIIKMWLESEV